MKNLAKLSVMTIALGNLYSVASSNALADSAHRFHGSVCNPNYSSVDAINYSAYGVYNAHTTGLQERVTCGINLKDKPTVKKVMIVVYDRNPTHNIDCSVELLVDNDLEPAPLNFTDSSTSNSTPSQTLDFDLFTDPVATNTIYVRCYLPPSYMSQESYLTTIVVETAN
jgi:hypothetical protein